MNKKTKFFFFVSEKTLGESLILGQEMLEANPNMKSIYSGQRGISEI
jgi:hypothetical protein